MRPRALVFAGQRFDQLGQAESEQLHVALFGHRHDWIKDIEESVMLPRYGRAEWETGLEPATWNL